MSFVGRSFRKVRKLIRDPRRFYADAALKRQGQLPSAASRPPKVAAKTAATKSKPSAKAAVVGKAKPKGAVAGPAQPRRKGAVAGPAQPKPKGAVAGPAQPKPATLPAWYMPFPGAQLTGALTSNKPLFLYIPWIAEHSNSLMSKIGGSGYSIAALDLFEDLHVPGRRREVLAFARNNPELYRRMVVRRLVPLVGRIAGVIFTFDWAPVMRIVASVCEQLGIPRILIPHESVFVDRDKYYWDVTAKAAVPVADVILCWGELQRQIFVERGYPADRIEIVGAPKFDVYHAYDPELTRERFAALFGLSSARRIILFATQPLDSQTNAKLARDSQRAAIQDLLAYAEKCDAQLIIRLPPSQDDVVGEALKAKLLASRLVAIDDSLCYLVSAEEALYHADVVTSVNSTMLFEGILMGRPALSLKYLEFSQIWEAAGIPVARNALELEEQMAPMLRGEWQPSENGIEWAARQFSTGAFDGMATQRIRAWLTSLANGNLKVERRSSALERLFAGEPLDVIAVPSSQKALATSQKYLQQMLRARTVVSSREADIPISTLASVEFFVQWGMGGAHTRNQNAYARRLGLPLVTIEDGFLRSKDIGLSGEPGLSIILDDTAPYYDATKVSKLQRLLEAGRDLSSWEFERSRTAIARIVQSRLSKYNHAPDLPLSIGVKGRKKVLLVDQRYGDQSVVRGLADERSFERMVMDVLRDRADCDIIVKQHPDAIKGGKSSYFSDERLAFAKYVENLHRVNFDVNPHSLFDIVDEVFVVTSGMGFEALMAGKAVTCYGVPFYAGWGLTNDKLTVPGRSRARSLEEVFHFAYIEMSRYFDPATEQRGEIEHVLAHLEGALGRRVLPRVVAA